MARRRPPPLPLPPAGRRNRNDQTPTPPRRNLRRLQLASRADPLPVEVTVHSLHGDRLDLPTVELPGETGRILNLNEALLEAGAAFQKGSLELRYSYEGCALVLSAGLILEDPAAGISFDELLTRAHHRVSRRLEGLWWVPSRSSKLELVLSNQSESPLTVTVTGQSLGRAAERNSLEVDLDSRETVRIDIREIRDGQQPDDNGTILPTDLSSGQLHWSAVGSGSLHSMVGRSEYFGTDGDLVSTFACSSCCGDSYESSLAEPVRFFIPDGGLQQVRAVQVHSPKPNPNRRPTELFILKEDPPSGWKTLSVEGTGRSSGIR